MNTSTQARILAVVGLAAMALFGAAGCKNSETPAAKCECPDKIHGSEPCACGGVDCACEQKEWTLNYGIKLDNQSGTPMGKDGKIALINEVLDQIHTSDSTAIDSIVAKNIQIIVESNSYSDYTKDGNNIKISIDSFVDKSFLGSVIGGAFLDAISMNNFNSNIRLANGKNLNMQAQGCLAPVLRQHKSAGSV